MARYRINMNASGFVNVNKINNGVVIQGPDFTNGKAILSEGKSKKEFEKEVREVAQSQIEKVKNDAEKFIKNFDSEHSEQIESFNEQLDNILGKEGG